MDITLMSMVDGIHKGQFISGLPGIVFSILFAVLLVPIADLIKFKSIGSVGDHSPTPHLTAILSSMLWVLYSFPSVQTGNILLAIGNAAVVFIGLFYLLLFAIYSKTWSDKWRGIVATLLLEIIFVAIFAATVLTVAHEMKIRHHVIGIVAMICQIGTHVAPISALKLAFKTHNVENIGGVLALEIFAEYHWLWLLYAWIPFDLYLFIPNVVGLVLAFLRYGLYLKWRKTLATEELPQWLFKGTVNVNHMSIC